MKLPSLAEHQDGFTYLDSRSRRQYPLFIVLLALLLVCAVLWAVFAELEQTLTSSALFRPLQYSSILKCNVSAHVSGKPYISGSMVKKGDILVIFDHDAQSRESSRLRAVLQLLQDQRKKLDWYALAIQADVLVPNQPDSGVQARLVVFKGEAERKRLLFEQSALRLRQEQAMPERLRDPARVAELNLQTRLLELEHETVLARELVNVLAERERIEQEITNTEYELSIVQRAIDNSVILAPIDGIVEDVKRFKEGEYIFAGEDIIRITPDGTGTMVAEMVIPNEYIGKVASGMTVYLQCNGLETDDSYKLSGIISHLSADSGLNPANPSAYIAEILVQAPESSDGEQLSISLIPGMQAVARLSLGRERFSAKLVKLLGFGK